MFKVRENWWFGEGKVREIHVELSVATLSRYTRETESLQRGSLVKSGPEDRTAIRCNAAPVGGRVGSDPIGSPAAVRGGARWGVRRRGVTCRGGVERCDTTLSLDPRMRMHGAWLRAAERLADGVVCVAMAWRVAWRCADH